MWISFAARIATRCRPIPMRTASAFVWSTRMMERHRFVTKLVCYFFVTLTLVSAPARAQATAEVPAIVVSGEGIVKATPDQAWVRIGAESRSKSAKDAQQRNAEVMTAVQQKLAVLGIPKDAVKTVGIDLQPEFDYNNGRQTLRGYVARNTIEVRIDDFSKVGEILDLAVGSGATSVSGVRFDIKDRDRVEREALRLAVVDARARAEAAAAGANLRLGDVVRIEEQRAIVAPPRPVMMAMRQSAEGMAADQTAIAPGELEIRSTVTMTVSVR